MVIQDIFQYKIALPVLLLRPKFNLNTSFYVNSKW